MTLPIGVAEQTPEQYNSKAEAQKDAPRAFLTLVRNATAPDGFEVVETNESAQRATISHTVSAINQILALLNFPHRLRGYLDTLIGLARNCEGNEFQATNKEVSLALRSGRKGSNDESAERNLRRLVKDLNDWQSKKNFLLVKRAPGKFDFENWKNETTRYEIPLLGIIDEVLTEARANPFFTKPGTHAERRRLQGIAIRKAALHVLFRIPNAPSLKPEPKRTLSTDELFDRRHRAMITFAEKNRDLLANNSMSHEEYFMFLVREMDKICWNPAGVAGAALTADADAPDKLSSIWKKIRTGQLLDELLGNDTSEYTGSEFEETILKVTNFNLENDSKLLNSLTDDGGAIDGVLSAPQPVEIEPVEDMKQAEVLPILENWKARINEKLPALQIPKNGWEITWQIFGSEAERTNDALNMSILKCEQRNLNMLDVKERFLDYVMARIKFWRDGTPFPQTESKLIEFRQKLSEFLKTDG